MEFLGMQVEGCGGEGENKDRPEQYDVDHFKDTVAKVLSHEEVTGIAWTQYTPYFNDGDPCIFRASDPSFSFVGVTASDEQTYFDYSWMEEDFEESGRIWCGAYNNGDLFDKIVGEDDKNWGEWTGSRSTREWTWKEGSGPENAPNPELFIDIHAFISFLNRGNYDHAVEDLFGDHAIIRIDKLAGKVVIDEYHHD